MDNQKKLLETKFELLSSYPPELIARFNSFITTEFDDSLTVEMQLRSIIKWASKNFLVVDDLIRFINDLTNFLKAFMNQFDVKLGETIITILAEWQESGKLDVVISEALQWEFDNFKEITEQRLLSTEQQLQQLTTNAKLYGAKGDGVANETPSIQAAIDYTYEMGGGTVLVPAGIYMIDVDVSINMKDNVFLQLTSNTKLKAIPTTSGEYSVINFQGVKNSGIYGGNATIEGERLSHVGTVGEWGHGIRIASSTDIYLDNFTIINCFGDGIDILRGVNVTILNTKSDNNRRQGMSIEGGTNIYVKNFHAKNTNGTLPSAGIDVEPFAPTNEMVNIVLEDIYTEKNAGYGIIVSATSLNNTKKKISVTVKNHYDNGSRGGFYCGDMIGVDGSIVYENAILNNNLLSGIYVDGHSADAIVDIINPTIIDNNVNNRTDGLYGAAIAIFRDADRTPLNSVMGNVNIYNPVIKDTRATARIRTGLLIEDLTGGVIKNVNIFNPVFRNVGVKMRYYAEESILEDSRGELEHSTSYFELALSKTNHRKTIYKTKTTNPNLVVTLPSNYGVGTKLTFVNKEGDQLILKPSVDEKIIPISQTNGELVRSSVVGASITVEKVVSGWRIIQQIGSWTAG